MYLMLKNIHMVFAGLSISGFILRGFWRAGNSRMLQNRATKVLPHVSDALFFVTGVWLVAVLNLNVLQHQWLLAKFAGLFFYIGLGMIAFRFGRTPGIKIFAFIGAILSFVYIVGVAWNKTPWSWLA
jgi:uncharacterized membrane protein SirB2